LTLEKPTRGKPVREGDFYYLGASEKFFYSMFIFRNLNDKLISITVPSLHTGNKPNSSKFFPEFSAINCRSAPRFCASKLLYGCLEIHANSFSKFLGALMVVRSP
jgi:hypothetical protein